MTMASSVVAARRITRGENLHSVDRQTNEAIAKLVRGVKTCRYAPSLHKEVDDKLRSLRRTEKAIRAGDHSTAMCGHYMDLRSSLRSLAMRLREW